MKTSGRATNDQSQSSAIDELFDVASYSSGRKIVVEAGRLMLAWIGYLAVMPVLGGVVLVLRVSIAQVRAGACVVALMTEWAK